MKKKVFVSGCFDLLHSGHIAFLKEANNYGNVYVNIGNDKNIKYLKGRRPINCELERKFLLESIKYVKECRINKGFGIIDFSEKRKKDLDKKNKFVNDWEEMMLKYQELIPNSANGEKWVKMNKIFQL